MSAALSPSWGSHSSLEPGQPFVPLQQWQWVLRGDFGPVVQGSDYGYLVGYGVM